MRMIRRLLAVLVSSDNDAEYVVSALGRTGILEIWESQSNPGLYSARFAYGVMGTDDRDAPYIASGRFKTSKGIMGFDGETIRLDSGHRYEFKALNS